MPNWTYNQLTIYSKFPEAIRNRLFVNEIFTFEGILPVPQDIAKEDTSLWLFDNWGCRRNGVFDYEEQFLDRLTMNFYTPGSGCLPVVKILSESYDVPLMYHQTIDEVRDVFYLYQGKKLTEQEFLDLIATINTNHGFLKGLLKETFIDYPEMIDEIFTREGLNLNPMVLDNVDSLMVAMAKNIYGLIEDCKNDLERTQNALSIIATMEEDLERAKAYLATIK